MKIRTSFVGNSSSSSFIAICAFPYPEAFEDVLEKLEAKHYLEEGVGYGQEEIKDGIRIYSWEYNPDFIGMDIESLLLDNKTIKECIQIFKEKLKKHDISEDKFMNIKFEYGTVGS